MTAIQRARSLVDEGQAYGLAIHITAREYGLSSRAIASELAGRRTRRPRKQKINAPINAWWNR